MNHELEVRAVDRQVAGRIMFMLVSILKFYVPSLVLYSCMLQINSWFVKILIQQSAIQRVSGKRRCNIFEIYKWWSTNWLLDLSVTRFNLDFY